MVPHTKLFGETVVISVDGNKLSHTSVDDLYCRTYDKKILAYWRKRRKHTQEAQNHVQWMSRQKHETPCLQAFIVDMPNMFLGTFPLLNYNSSVNTRIMLNAHVATKAPKLRHTIFAVMLPLLPVNGLRE
jgi:hypothetical protein